MLGTAGKVPQKVCAAADEYLWQQYKAGADVAPAALSFPTEQERSNYRSNLLPHCGGPEEAIGADSLRCWVSIMMTF